MNTLNSTSTNICVQLFAWIPVYKFGGIMSCIIWHFMFGFFFFWEDTKLSRMYTSTNFFTPLPISVIFLMIAILMYTVCYLLGFYLHYLMTNDVKCLFSVFWSFVYHHWRNFYSSPLSIFYFGLSFWSCIVYVLSLFWILDNIRYMICKYFLSFCGVYFYFPLMTSDSQSFLNW